MAGGVPSCASHSPSLRHIDPMCEPVCGAVGQKMVRSPAVMTR
jgi:hypothetical protein